MTKHIVAIFFSVIFISLITAPTVLVIIDSGIDVALLYDVSEEEEEKNSEKNKELEVFVVDLETELTELFVTKDFEQLGHAFKSYPKPHLNLIFPPPEFSI